MDDKALLIILFVGCVVVLAIATCTLKNDIMGRKLFKQYDAMMMHFASHIVACKAIVIYTWLILLLDVVILLWITG